MGKESFNWVSADKSVYLNAFELSTNGKSVDVLQIKSDHDAYGNIVKPKLIGCTEIAFWTPKTDEKFRTTYIASINSRLDDAREKIASMLRDSISIGDTISIKLGNKSVKLIEDALRKLLIKIGWNCRLKFGNSRCISNSPLKSLHSFLFYREIQFRINYVDEHLLLIIRPALHIKGPYISNLINKFGYSKVKPVLIDKECVAPYIVEKDVERDRKAIIRYVRQERETDTYVLGITFFDGVEAEVTADKVRLTGSILLNKQLITKLYGYDVYKNLEKTQRSLAFSLGTKESAYRLGEIFKETILKIIEGLNIFPFTLSNLKVGIKSHELFKVEE